MKPKLIESMLARTGSGGHFARSPIYLGMSVEQQGLNHFTNSHNPCYSPGFTLIELTLTLALMGILMSLVIVRFDVGSPRQQVIAEARKLGNIVRTYREKALEEEQLYALRLDAGTGQYAIYKPLEKDVSVLEKSSPIKSASLSAPVQFGAINLQGTPVASPVVFFFNPSGVLPDASIELLNPQKSSVILKINPVVNEINYAESGQ